MSHLFLTRWVSQLLGLALVPWAFARIGAQRPSLRLPYLMFSTHCYLQLDFNRVSSLRPTYRHPFGRPFTYSLLRGITQLVYDTSSTAVADPMGAIAPPLRSWNNFFKGGVFAKIVVFLHKLNNYPLYLHKKHWNYCCSYHNSGSTATVSLLSF